MSESGYPGFKDFQDGLLENVLKVFLVTSKVSEPNPQPLPYQGRGVRIKASLPVGERFGEGFRV